MGKYNVGYQETINDINQVAAPNENFLERAEITREVITRRPDFIEKWALIIFSFVLLSAIAGAWFIQYPDLIEGRAVLIGEDGPKEIIAKQSGKLIALFAKNNQTVHQGEIIGWLESNADTKEIIDLADTLNHSTQLLQQGFSKKISDQYKNHHYGNLGEIQNSYQTFIASLQQYDDYLANGFYYNRKNILKSDILAMSIIREKTSVQRNLSVEDNELAKKTFEMNETLFKEKVISADEYRHAQSTLKNKQMSLPQIEANIIGQENQIRNKQKEIDQLNHDILQQQKIFEQALNTLKSNVTDWIRKYTLQASVAGQIEFIIPIQQNQFIEQGRLLAFVNPPDSKYYAEVRLSQSNFGKIDTGMKVQLRFDAYPYQEMGFVTGHLNYLSKVAIDTGFIGTVRLDRGLKTNQNKELQYKNGLHAQAIIITKEMRLLERLYYNIIKATSPAR
jgi:HlyD family secretion protein